MSSLKADFDELRERIRHGRELGHASFEPIYYLIFDPADIIEVETDIRRPGPSSCATKDGRSVYSRLLKK